MAAAKQLDIPDTLPGKHKEFLDRFHDKTYVYIPDYNDERPVIQSEMLDLSGQEKGYGVFFSVNGFKGEKREQEHMTVINTFFADIDYPDKVNKNEEKVRRYKNELTQELVNIDLLPTAIVETKNGLHVYWMLEQPILFTEHSDEEKKDILETYVNIERSIIDRFDADPGAKDPSRVLRVPSTYHQKDKNNPFKCKLVHYAETNVYTFAEIRSKFNSKSKKDKWAEINSEQGALEKEVKEKVVEDYPLLERPSYQKMLNREEDLIDEGERNNSLLIIASACRRAGWPKEKTKKHFTDEKGWYGLGVREIQRTINSAYDHEYEFGYNNEIMSDIVEPDERQKLSKVTSKHLSDKGKQEAKKDKERQRKMFNTYEYVLGERYPHLLYKKNGKFYNYEGGVYKRLTEEEIKGMILREMLKDGLVNYRSRSRVLDKMACFRSIPEKGFTSDEENPDKSIINLNNGLLDIENFEFKNHTPEYLSTTQIPVSFDKKAECPKWRNFCNEIMSGKEEQVKLLQEIAGYCLTTEVRYQKAFIFIGSGGNGKGTFIDRIQNLVGPENSSNLKLGQINNRFGKASLIGSRLNIVDEISNNYFESDIIKSLISGERMEAELKNIQEKVKFDPMAKFVFTVNSFPKINDQSEALYRRFIIVPFEENFRDNPDPYLEDKLDNELEGILNWSLEGLKRLKKNGKFTTTKRNEMAMKEFRIQNSPIAEFVKEKYHPVDEDHARKYTVDAQKIYKKYRSYCYDSGYRPKGKHKFFSALENVDNYSITKFRGKGNQVKLMGVKSKKNSTGNNIVYNDIT